MSRMIIYLDLLLPTGSSDLPEARGPRCASNLGLASDGVYMCPLCYHRGGSLLHCPSTLTTCVAVYFCCTGLGVTSTGRYPASCPMKPGLSSPVKYSRDRLFSLHNYRFYHVYPRLSKIFISFLFVSLLQPIHTYFQYTISKNISLFETRHSFWR